MAPIRVGIIRCDLHALYYAALIDKHDPLKLRDPRLPASGKRRDSWQSGGAHYYHYTHYADATRMTVPRVAGFRIVRLWDDQRELAETAAEVFDRPPLVCDRFEDVSDDVDLVFIADCNGDGSDHLELATPGLTKRVPTFIDKPLAYDIDDAVAIVALAKKRRTPMLSISILRSVPEAARFKRRLSEVGELEFGTVKGGSAALAGQIHTISLAQHVFGNGVDAVDAMGPGELAFAHLTYGGRPDRPTHGVVLHCDVGRTWHCNMYASAYGTEGAIHSGGIGDFVFPKGAARNMQLAKKMVRTGKPPIDYDDILENIAVATAGRRAKTLGRPVRLAEVWKRRGRRQRQLT